MINYYVTILERFHLEEDPEQAIPDHRPFLIRANDKVSAHEKLHKFLYEYNDKMEGEWYISFEDNTRERIYSITQIITPSDLGKVLPDIE